MLDFGGFDDFIESSKSSQAEPCDPIANWIGLSLDKLSSPKLCYKYL